MNRNLSQSFLIFIISNRSNTELMRKKRCMLNFLSKVCNLKTLTSHSSLHLSMLQSFCLVCVASFCCQHGFGHGIYAIQFDTSSVFSTWFFFYDLFKGQKRFQNIRHKPGLLSFFVFYFRVEWIEWIMRDFHVHVHNLTNKIASSIQMLIGFLVNFKMKC